MCIYEPFLNATNVNWEKVTFGYFELLTPDLKFQFMIDTKTMRFWCYTEEHILISSNTIAQASVGFISV